MTRPKSLSSAPPPWHSVAFIVTVTIIVILRLPTLDALDGAATLDAFISPVVVASLPPLGIAAIRLSFAAFIFGVTVKRCLGPGVSPQPTYLPKSRLISEPLELVGLGSLAPFTWWSWVLLGVSFFLSGTIPLLHALGRIDLVYPWHLRLAFVSFEVAAPCACLVSFVVKYALWPHVLKARGREAAGIFRGFYSIVTHNLNVIMVVAEAALVGGLRVEMSHVAIAPVLGSVYAVYAWRTSDGWGTKTPQFLYFFLDTTLPGYTPTIALAALLMVHLTFFSIFSVVDDVLGHLGGGVLGHMAGAVLAGAALCRFKD